MNDKERLQWAIVLAVILATGWLFQFLVTMLGPADGVTQFPVWCVIAWVVSLILRLVYLAGMRAR